MSEMIERVAQVIMAAADCAICDRLVYDGAAHHKCNCERPTWQEASPENKARAVLAVMREPTEAMVDHAWKWSDYVSHETLKPAWRLMIDAALLAEDLPDNSSR